MGGSEMPGRHRVQRGEGRQWNHTDQQPQQVVLQHSLNASRGRALTTSLVRHSAHCWKPSPC